MWVNNIEAKEGIIIIWGERHLELSWGTFLGNTKTHGMSQVLLVGKSEIKMRMFSIN